MASMRGKLLKYLRNHFTMLEMTYEFGQSAYICGK